MYNKCSHVCHGGLREIKIILGIFKKGFWGWDLKKVHNYAPLCRKNTLAEGGNIRLMS